MQAQSPTHRAALARTYRPKRFEDVVMQEHAAETLRSAVARGRTAHAYLFCGPRGVGKTTAARVLAMALNCPNRSTDGEPCGGCESCDRIWSGRTSLDVVEIDAASNRGVEDARDLRERAMYAPTDEQRYKVYIIDEAHMLTREAWNTLLKVLEEPPPRVIFVFATTEPQKIQQVAPPILSRCQRFDFRRIPVAAIVERLRSVLAAEGSEVGDDALIPIARRADGGMRDALSLLDQVLSFAGDGVTADDVRRVLGLIGDELYLELFEILAERRYGDVFRFVQRLLDEGYDLTEFYRGLADALRALLVARFDGEGAAEVREDLRAGYAAVAERFGTGDLLRMLALVAELDTEGRFRKSASPRTMLEALLLRFAYLDRTVDVEAVLTAAATGTPLDAAIPRSSPQRGEAARSAGSAPQGPAPRSSSPRRETGRNAGPPAHTGRPAKASAVATRSSAQRGEAERDAAAPAAMGRDRARTALDAVLAQRRGMPAGLTPFLKAQADITEAEAGQVILTLPPGPGFEKLSDQTVQAALASALSAELGESIKLEVRLAGADTGPAGGGSSAPARLTPERVKADKLARLAEDQPGLGKAVREWDLELLD